ncbi:MAG: class I SAM-dependent methyltransferase [bacterium]
MTSDLTNFYAQLAPLYDLFYASVTEVTANDVAFVRWALGDREPGQTQLIDLACGTGRHLVPLAQAGYQVIGLDLSAHMLDQAAAKCSVADIRVPLHQADMRDLPDLEPVDAIICMLSAISHMLTVDDLQRALRGIHGLLKPGGTFIMDTVNSVWLLERFKPEIVTFHPIPHGYVQRTTRHRIESANALLHHEEYILRVTSEGARGQSLTTPLRLFTWPELQLHLRLAGFAEATLYGESIDRVPATEGAHRLLIVARRAREAEPTTEEFPAESSSDWTADLTLRIGR